MSAKINTALDHFRCGLTNYLKNPNSFRLLKVIPALSQAAEALIQERLQILIDRPSYLWLSEIRSLLSNGSEKNYLTIIYDELRARTDELEDEYEEEYEAIEDDETLVCRAFVILLENFEPLFQNGMEKRVPIELLRAIQKRLYSKDQRKKIATQRLARWKDENWPDGEPSEYHGTLPCPHCGDEFEFLMKGFHPHPFCFCCNTSMDTSPSKTRGDVTCKKTSCCAIMIGPAVSGSNESADDLHVKQHVSNEQFIAILNRLHQQGELDVSTPFIKTSDKYQKPLIDISNSPIQFDGKQFKLNHPDAAKLPVTKVSPNGARWFAELFESGRYRVHAGHLKQALDFTGIGLTRVVDYRPDELILVTAEDMIIRLGIRYTKRDRVVLAGEIHSQWQFNLLYYSPHQFPVVIDREIREYLVKESTDWNRCAYSFRLDLKPNPAPTRYQKWMAAWRAQKAATKAGH